MSKHPLDRAVWSALSARQTEFAAGGARARRFQPAIGPLAASRDDSPESLAELAELVPEGGRLILLQAEPIAIPSGVETVSSASGVLMVADRIESARDDLESRVEPLGEKDWPEMHQLAQLAKPGPFEKETPRLGDFFGIREKGVLLAMAGERMRLPGYAEVSGVCSHPDARGRGFGRALSAFVAARILARGETPFLHAYSTNLGAIRLYASLGFRVRSQVNIAVVGRGSTDPTPRKTRKAGSG